MQEGKFLANMDAPELSISPEVLSKVFSVGAGDPLTLGGPRPGDVLTLSGSVLEPCEELGLLCESPLDGAQDDLTSLSYGWDFEGMDSLLVEFSVGAGSSGAAGSAVWQEKNCTVAEPQGDVFASPLNASNYQELDGNGIACTTNAGFGLSILEGAASDNIDALERDPCRSVDLDCESRLEDLVYFTLGANSPSLGYLGASAGDILVVGIDYAPRVWAKGTTDLGLQNGDAIDALCLREDGNGIFDDGDLTLFSLKPGSPSVGGPVISAADLIRPGLRIGVSPAAIGLLNADNLDAAICHGRLAMSDLYLPIIVK